MRFAFVEKHRESIPTERLFRIVDVSPRSYRAWRVPPASRRQREDMVLLTYIRKQHRLYLNSYGRPRILAQAFVAHPAIEAIHKTILRRLARSDVMPLDHLAIRPVYPAGSPLWQTHPSLQVRNSFALNGGPHHFLPVVSSLGSTGK